MDSFILHSDDHVWKACYLAVQANSDSLELWERLIDQTERIQANASELIRVEFLENLDYLKSHMEVQTLDKNSQQLQTPSAPKKRIPKRKKPEDQQQQQQSAPTLKDGQVQVVSIAFPVQYTSIKNTTRHLYKKMLDKFPLLFAYWIKYAQMEVAFSEEKSKLFYNLKKLTVSSLATSQTNYSVTELQAQLQYDNLHSAEKLALQNEDFVKFVISNEKDDIFCAIRHDYDWDSRLNVSSRALRVYQKAGLAFPMSMDVWIAYLDFLIAGLVIPLDIPAPKEEEEEGQQQQQQQESKIKKEQHNQETRDLYSQQIDYITQIFETARSHIGRDFLSDSFWDKYIAFLQNHEAYSDDASGELARLEALTTVLASIARIPLHQYARYYEQFTETIAVYFDKLKNGKVIDSWDDLSIEDDVALKVLTQTELNRLKKSSANESNQITAQAILDHFANVIFLQTQTGTNDRWNFESLITRNYFHVLELDQEEIDNWDKYINWETEKYFQLRETYKQQKETPPDESVSPEDIVDLETISDEFLQLETLYERALVPCAMYDTFWLKYTRSLYNIADTFLQNKYLDVPDDDSEVKTEDENIKTRAKEIYEQFIEKARNAYIRASTVFVPITRPFIRFQYALFEESLGEIEKSRSILNGLQEAMCVAASKMATNSAQEFSKGGGNNNNNKIKSKNDFSNRYENYRSNNNETIEDEGIDDEFESSLIGIVDESEPFFYRLEFERRVGGPFHVLEYIDMLLQDNFITQNSTVFDLLKPTLDFPSSNKQEEKKNTSFFPLKNHVLSFKIKSLLVSTRAQLISSIGWSSVEFALKNGSANSATIDHNSVAATPAKKAAPPKRGRKSKKQLEQEANEAAAAEAEKQKELESGSSSVSALSSSSFAPLIESIKLTRLIFQKSSVSPFCFESAHFWVTFFEWEVENIKRIQQLIYYYCEMENSEDEQNKSKKSTIEALLKSFIGLYNQDFELYKRGLFSDSKPSSSDSNNSNNIKKRKRATADDLINTNNNKHKDDYTFNPLSMYSPFSQTHIFSTDKFYFHKYKQQQSSSLDNSNPLLPKSFGPILINENDEDNFLYICSSAFIQNMTILYLDPIVDLLLSKVGIPPVVIADLIRTYIDDILVGLLGGGVRTSANADSTTIVKQEMISNNNNNNSDDNPDKNLFKLKPVVELNLNPTILSSTNSTATSFINNDLTDNWSVNRAIDLELELTGPLTVKRRYLCKISSFDPLDSSSSSSSSKSTKPIVTTLPGGVSTVINTNTNTEKGYGLVDTDYLQGISGPTSVSKQQINGNMTLISQTMKRLKRENGHPGLF